MKLFWPTDRRDALLCLNEAESAPPVWAWIIPLIAGTGAYFVFAEKLEVHEGSFVWWEELLEVSPALMMGLLYLTFVLLPLRRIFARARISNPVLFLAVGMLFWIAISVFVLQATNALSQQDIWVDASVIVPGFVIAIVFTMISAYSGPNKRL